MFGYDETNNNYKYAKKEIEYVAETYSHLNHVLYENKTWLIQNDDMINEYNNYLRQNGINIDNVVKIEKKHHYQEKGINIYSNNKDEF